MHPLPQKQRKQATAMCLQTIYMYTSQPNTLQSSYKSQRSAFTETPLGDQLKDSYSSESSRERVLIKALTFGSGPNSDPRNRMVTMTIPDERKPTSCVFPPVLSWRMVRLRAPAVGKLPKNAPPKFMIP